MQSLDSKIVLQALRDLGEQLGRNSSFAPVTLVLAGGSAGMLGGMLAQSRSTADCDVIWNDGASRWNEVERAANLVGERDGLPPRWLNRDCAMYAWCLPLEWRARCEPVGKFGPLNVLRLSRLDLIAAKVVSSPKRPQDLQDLRTIGPTAEELNFVDEHLDRLEAEHLGGMKFEDQRAIVRVLGETR